MTADNPDSATDSAPSEASTGEHQPSADGVVMDVADSKGDGEREGASAPPTSSAKPTASKPETNSEPPAGSAQTGRPDDLAVPDGVDWRGWVLVAIVVLSFVVIPVFVYYIPEMHSFIGALGFSQRQAYILFPMLPAIVLGITAVWAALRTHSR